MVVTGFEVFDAIAATIGLLNLARQGFDYLAKRKDDYGKVGSQMVEIQSECHCLHFIINECTKFWDLDQQKPDRFYKAYWGERGWQLLDDKLGMPFGFEVCFAIACLDLRNEGHRLNVDNGFIVLCTLRSILFPPKSSCLLTSGTSTAVVTAKCADLAAVLTKAQLESSTYEQISVQERERIRDCLQ